MHADSNKKYPYTAGFKGEIGIDEGKGFTKNYPLPIKISEKEYIQTLRKALQDIHRFGPSYLILSAGFDTYYRDPIGGLGLKISSYQLIGKNVASLKLPTLIIQEGGYMIEDLGKMAV